MESRSRAAVEPEAEARMSAQREGEFLLEIGTEEIPAHMLAEALNWLREHFPRALEEARLSPGEVKVYGTSRRLILHAPAVGARQADMDEQMLGPSKTVAFDKEGNPTPALTGFLRKSGAQRDQIRFVSTPKGEYVTFQKQVPGKPAAQVLQELLPQFILSIPFAKSMYWRETQERFVRPIHYLLALLHGSVLPFEVAGISSGSQTRGHLILAPQKFHVASFAELQEKLAAAFVLIDPKQRREIIEMQLAASVPAGAEMLRDPELLDEVVNLIEYPQVLLGEFEERFLTLPAEILVTVLKKHQKYFSLVDRKGGIRPYFLTVMNTASLAAESIRKGHQRVLRARLEDAAFYREFDARRKLEERVALLDSVTFQKKLGSYGEKILRMQPLAKFLAQEVSEPALGELESAVKLCKTDLTTEMVREFTELQGIVGGLYASAEQYPESVWKAVYQHYQPLSTEGPIPDSRVGQILSIVDKTDTLCGSFSIGIIPTGSSDPFSLRRYCQGIVRIAWEGQLAFSLKRLLEKSLELLQGKSQRKPAETLADLMEFMAGRVRYLLAEKGVQHDVIEAVVAAGIDDLVDLWRRAEAVQAIRRDPDFEAIATSFKRVRNILGSASEDGGSLSEELLQDPAEKALAREIGAREPSIRADLGRHDYYQALKTLAQVRPVLDQFFDKVLVMAEDAALRRNRLLLLRRLSDLYRRVGDLSLISS